jgi:hypothetical protein
LLSQNLRFKIFGQVIQTEKSVMLAQKVHQGKIVWRRDVFDCLPSVRATVAGGEYITEDGQTISNLKLVIDKDHFFIPVNAFVFMN